jgi:hypothetical protein
MIEVMTSLLSRLLSNDQTHVDKLKGQSFDHATDVWTSYTSCWLDRLVVSGRYSGMQNLNHAEVDALLSSKRKIRSRNKKACYPCHRRKIKCDQNRRTSCTNCQKSPHPELCSYQRSLSSRAQLPDRRNSPSVEPMQHNSGEKPSWNSTQPTCPAENDVGHVRSEFLGDNCILNATLFYLPSTAHF